MVWLGKVHLWLAWLRLAFLLHTRIPVHTTHIIAHNPSPFVSHPLPLFAVHYFPSSLFCLAVFLKACSSVQQGFNGREFGQRGEPQSGYFTYKTGRKIPLIWMFLFGETSLWHTCVRTQTHTHRSTHTHTHTHIHTLTQNRPRMAWECFLQPLWLPMVTSEMVFINYVDSEFFLPWSVSLFLLPITLSPLLSPLCIFSPCRKGSGLVFLLTWELLQRITVESVVH